MYLLLCAALIGTSAAPAPPAEIPPELSHLAAKMRRLRSLKVRMRQEKELTAFGEVIRSEGTLVFARPRRLRMDLSGPGGTTLVIDGDTMSIHYKALDRTDHARLSRDPRSRAVAEHLFLLLDANPEALGQIYGLEVMQKQPLRVRLTPRAAQLAAIIRRVDARFDARGFVAELVLHESAGDTTRWTFDSPTLNEPTDDALFRLASPSQNSE